MTMVLRSMVHYLEVEGLKVMVDLGDLPFYQSQPGVAVDDRRGARQGGQRRASQRHVLAS